MEDLDYKKDVEIDPDALDVEWLNQSALGLKYGKHWAECNKKLQTAQEHIKLVRSQLVARANEDPEGCLGKGVKPTKDNVEAYYRDHEDHIDAKKDIIQVQYELDIADVAKWQIANTRKDALENLVKLHGQNYFAGPSVPRDLSYANIQIQEQRNADVGVAKRLKRKPKRT